MPNFDTVLATLYAATGITTLLLALATIGGAL